MPPKTLQIRNSTAEFLIFTKQAGENGVEVRVQDGTIWLSQNSWQPCLIALPTTYPCTSKIYLQMGSLLKFQLPRISR